MKRYLLLMLMSITFLTPLSHAEVFKCISGAGKTIFKDSECNHNERLEKRIHFKALSKTNTVSESGIDSNDSLGKNLIQNFSFENKLTDWRVPADALWTRDGGSNSSGALIIHAKKPPDDKYIHETVVEQCIALGPGEKFEFSAQFISSKTPQKASANRANVIWYESIDCTTGGQWGNYIEPNISLRGWQKLSKYNLTPALGAIAVKITIVQNGRYSNDGEGYWDNMFFAATKILNQSESHTDKKPDKAYTLAPGVNHAQNGVFNSDIFSWRPVWKTEWSGAQGDTSPGSAKVTAHSKSGIIGSSAFSQCINFGESSIFELGASFKRDETSSQKGGGRLRLTWHENQNCGGRAKTDTRWADPEDMAGWQKLRISGLFAPPNSRSATLEVIQSVSGKGQFIAYWDDIYFKSVK